MPLRPVLLITLVLLQGCQSLHSHFQSARISDCTAPAGADGMELDLVRQQMAAGKHHAALAHLDRIGDNQPHTLLLRARAARSIGDLYAADHAYRALLDTCLNAYAHQGLGIIAADRRDLRAALDHLQMARQLAPIDASVRNDYGFVLLAANRIDAALREFRTAMELTPADPLPVHNLVLALFIAERGEEAQQLARQHTLDEAMVDTLADRARQFRPLPPNPAEVSVDETYAKPS